MTLEQFKNGNTPKKSRSILWPHCEDILDLYKSDYTLEQIREYLSAKKIQTTKANLSAFIHRHQQKEEASKTEPNVEIKNSNSDQELMKKWLKR